MKPFFVAALGFCFVWIDAGQALAQGYNITGNWNCGSTVRNGARAATAMRFGLALYPNRQFRAAGITSSVGSTYRGSGQVQFSALGTWQIVSGQSGNLLVLRGRLVPSDGSMPHNFSFGSYIRGPRLMAYNGTQGGASFSTSCRR